MEEEEGGVLKARGLEASLNDSVATRGRKQGRLACGFLALEKGWWSGRDRESRG